MEIDTDLEKKNSHSAQGVLLAALGVVYGDIGTSPLYALRECFTGTHGLVINRPAVLGVLSLVFWSLILIVTIKYLIFILRADNRGEGGMFALSALVSDVARGNVRLLNALAILGVAGASLVYADAMITPAISVLSAVEGLEKAAPGLSPFVVPIAAGIVIMLFAVQSVGTAGVGKIFGPIVLVWFLTLGTLGIISIVRNPEVLAAINPLHAFAFLIEQKLSSFFILGSIFLVVTGSEALYADMGHFGPRPIRMGWAMVVLPGLTLNYFGQGAVVLRDPDRAPTLFFELAPSPLLIPLILLSCAATIIASQAMISGAFSLTRQAVQLGYLPRLEIRQTSKHSFGQIYVPMINWLLLAGVLTLLFSFGSSSALAGAYGLAISGAMLISSIFLYHAARRCWGWPQLLATLVLLCFLIPDSAFLVANLLKIPNGGWFPLVLASLLGVVLSTWKKGRQVLHEKLAKESLPLELFIEEVGRIKPHRVEGTAVFLTGNPTGVPVTLLHNYKHNKVLHERIILLNVLSESIPYVEETSRSTVTSPGLGFHTVRLRYGFSESPNVPAALEKLSSLGFEINPLKITYFLGRETLVISRRKIKGLPLWRKRLFLTLSRNAQTATRFFEIPPNRVIELGVQIEL